MSNRTFRIFNMLGVCTSIKAKILLRKIFDVRLLYFNQLFETG